jgi:di/tricarboxylate transporter
MATSALLTLIVIVVAVILFITEWLSVDLIGLLILLSLTVTGVITPAEGVAGFSNSATLTVAFMFVLSAALLKTGALQVLSHRLSGLFRRQPLVGMFALLLFVAVISAFINNTPVVAVFIPVVLQVAKSTGISPAQLLIPLSYASILGGMCTLIGTSTNILVSGIATENGLPPFSMFQLAPIGGVLLIVGLGYTVFIGRKLLPNRADQDLSEEFGLHEYLTEIVLLDRPALTDVRIMDSVIVKELEMDILEVRRNGSRFTLPAGDFVLQPKDTLKVRCDAGKIKALKDWIRVADPAAMQIGGSGLDRRNTTLLELVVTANSSFEGKTLRDLDFRRKYRGIPLAIRHREEVLHEHLYELPMRAGDVILAEIKSHYVPQLKQLERQEDAPFILLSEDTLQTFDRRSFALVSGTILTMIVLTTANVLPIMTAVMLSVVALVLTRTLTMQELYESINWKIIFLLAGALSLGTAMFNSGLDQQVGTILIRYLLPWGPYALVAGLYLITALLTELMSNNATAALLAPIAIATAHGIGIDPLPLLLTITIAASASFMTPVGYQTNTMVYSAGRYRFTDFLRVGGWLTLICWILTTLLVPFFYPF